MLALSTLELSVESVGAGASSLEVGIGVLVRSSSIGLFEEGCELLFFCSVCLVLKTNVVSNNAEKMKTETRINKLVGLK